MFFLKSAPFVVLSLVVFSSASFAADAKKAAAKADNAESQEQTSSGSKNIWDDLGVGPGVSLGLPRPVGFGVEAKYTNYWGASLDYGFLPTYTLSNVSVGLKGFDFKARVFPFAGSFFIGAGLGSQSFTGSISETIAGKTATIDATASTFFMTPMIGWRWGGLKGLVFGMELGWQMAMSSSSNINLTIPGLTATNTDVVKLTTDMNSALDSIGRVSFPHVTLLHMSYLF